MHIIYTFILIRVIGLHQNLQAITKRSHVSIWKWIQKYSEYADKFKVDRHLVKEIFVNETLVNSSRSEQNLEEGNQSTLMALTGIMMHVNG